MVDFDAEEREAERTVLDLGLTEHAMQRLLERTRIDPAVLIATVTTNRAVFVGMAAARRRLYLMYDSPRQTFVGIVTCPGKRAVVTVLDETMVMKLIDGPDSRKRERMIRAMTRAGISRLDARRLVDDPATRYTYYPVVRALRMSGRPTTGRLRSLARLQLAASDFENGRARLADETLRQIVEATQTFEREHPDLAVTYCALQSTKVMARLHGLPSKYDLADEQIEELANAMVKRHTYLGASEPDAPAGE